MLDTNGDIDCISGKEKINNDNIEKEIVMDDMLRQRKGKIISCAKDTIEQGKSSYRNMCVM